MNVVKREEDGREGEEGDERGRERAKLYSSPLYHTRRCVKYHALRQRAGTRSSSVTEYVRRGRLSPLSWPPFKSLSWSLSSLAPLSPHCHAATRSSSLNLSSYTYTHTHTHTHVYIYIYIYIYRYIRAFTRVYKPTLSVPVVRSESLFSFLLFLPSTASLSTCRPPYRNYSLILVSFRLLYPIQINRHEEMQRKWYQLSKILSE